MKPGIVFIDQLAVDCVIGVHDFERGSRQQLLISLELSVNMADAVAADSIEHTIDYAAVAEQVRSIARDGRFRLLETLAEAIASALLKVPVERIRLEIDKPAALGQARGAGVRIERRQPSHAQ